MKTLNSYISEAANTTQEKFVGQVSFYDPTTERGVKNYFLTMFRNGICMHPDDFWEDCTLKFTPEQCEVLNKFIETAIDTFGDKVYEWASEALDIFYRKKQW